MKILKNSLFLFALFSVLTSCKPKDKNTYSNDFFHFNMQLPNDWNVQTEEELNKISKSVNGAFDKSESIATTSELSKKTGKINLLAAFEYEIGSDVPFNPSVIVMADNLKDSPSIVQGSAYLLRNKKLLERYEMMHYKCSEPVLDTKTINDKAFYTMQTELKVNELNIKQTYFTSVIDQFALTFIVSYTTDEQLKTLIKTLESIKFSN